jgi:hypothetical protein
MHGMYATSPLVVEPLPNTFERKYEMTMAQGNVKGDPARARRVRSARHFRVRILLDPLCA